MEAGYRVIDSLFARLDGPLHFRFIVQPAMAAILAVIDGVKDAKVGNPAYFWAVVSDPEKRNKLMHLGWKRVEKVFILAVILDVIYQCKVGRGFYPGQTLIVAIGLAIVPYLLFRGPINRLMQFRQKRIDRRLQAGNHG
jgi:hypothetical protein